VGGTDFDDVGVQTNFWNPSTGNTAGTLESVKGYIPETTWNDSCAATATAATLNTVCASATNITAGSGGPSGNPSVNGISKPAFQNGLTPADGARDLPDVSLFASDGPQSHSFYPVCEADAAGGQPSCTGANFVIGGAGGTSASSPAFAGIMALINQQQHGRQGNPNVVLYQIAATPANVCNSSTQTLAGSATCAFYDITKGNDSVPCAVHATPPPNPPLCSSPTPGTNGVLVDPANPTTPAWTAKAGYDLATGLGSVNVTNLAAKWATAVGAFKGTTTGLTLNGGTSTVTITHGATVNGIATVSVVAPAVGTPTGDVALLAGAAGSINSGNNFSTLGGNGSPPNMAPLSTTFLPGGSYGVTAHYAGDGTFGPSDSNAVQVVVNKENSRLQYEIVLLNPITQNGTVGPTTYVYGSALSTLRMDILNSSAGLCQPTPIFSGADVSGCAIDSTGKVMVTDNGSPLDGGTFNVNAAGNVEDQNLQLAVGAHTLSGTYSGDISYNPVTIPVIVTTTVTQAPTTAAVIANPTTVAAGAQVVLSATVSTNSFSTVGPTGTVTFFNGGTAIGSAVMVTSSGAAAPNFAGATATLNTSFGTAGTKSITATYNGDTNYAASAASPAATVTVTGTSNTPTITTLSPTTIVAGSAGFTLTVNGTNFASGATVNFGTNTPVTTFVSATQVTAAITAAQIATAATVGVTVTNPGGGGTSNSVNFTITAGTPSFTVSGAAAAATAGSPAMSTITVTPAGGFTGMVAITCPTLPPGVTCSALSINVTTANPTMGTLAVNTTAGSSSTMASLVPTDHVLSAGNVAPVSGGKAWWTLSGGTGLAALVLLILPGRKRQRAALGLVLVCLLSFTFGCSGMHNGGGMTATTTHLMVSSTKVAATGMITVSATVTGGTPTGMVQFFVDGAAAGNAVALTNGSTGNITATVANVPTLFQLVGTHTLSAHYLGSTSTGASQSGSLNIAITGTTNLAITGTAGATTGNGTVALTIN